MKEFDLHIAQQKKRYQKMLLAGGFLLLSVLMTVLLIFIFVRGHTFEVQPQKAQLSRTFSISQGMAVVIDSKLYTLSDITKVIIQADHFITHTETITADSKPTLVIKMQPKPSKLIVKTHPEDKETAWYIDNELLQVSRKLDIELKPGSYQLKIDSPFFHVLTQSVEIHIDEEKRLKPELNPVSGTMKLHSQPEAATVFIDGKNVGLTPVNVQRMGGRYQVRIELDGYQMTQDNIVLTNKAPDAKRSYQLSPKKSFLDFVLKPVKGDLLIDGKQITEISRIAVSANQNHTILYQKSGYTIFKKNIKLKPNEKKQINIVLQPQFTQVLLQSTPASNVRVDGKFLGKTPLKLKLLSSMHQISFTKEGYRTVVKNIRPVANSGLLVNINLLTEFEARRQQGKPTFAESIGINMVSFSPTEFWMGSVVNESGRRRNEDRKKVKFRRHIWVSQHEITEAIYHKFHPATMISQLPVSNITWLDAVKFCNWLSRQEGLVAFYNLKNGQFLGVNTHSKGYRLPTEAEWEWLARKANRASETKFVWGDMLKPVDNTANLSDESVKTKNTFYLKKYHDGFESRSPVGSFKAEASGLYDLAGNVSEWVHDYYDVSPTAPIKSVTDPMGPASGDRHFFKGANYNSGRLTELRAAYREPLSGKLPTVGFRIVRYD